MKGLLTVSVSVAALVAFAMAPSPTLAGDVEASTPAPLVAAYESLADVLLGANQTEWNLVHAILAGTYKHAEGVLARAKMKMEAGTDARGDLETLASLVSQLGNEGDASVAAIRKRLLEGGHHHHHASGEDDSQYDEGFVIVTRAAKKVFLDASKNIGKLSRSPDAKALDAEWKRVAKQFQDLHEGGKG